MHLILVQITFKYFKFIEKPSDFDYI